MCRLYLLKLHVEVVINFIHETLFCFNFVWQKFYWRLLSEAKSKYTLKDWTDLKVQYLEAFFYVQVFFKESQARGSCHHN